MKADDFFASGLDLPANISNIYKAGIVPVTIKEMPGLNGLGIALARGDLAEGGLFPPHIHPRGTEIVTVLEGSLNVGFVTTNPGYTHYNKTVEKGGVFVVPPGLVHYAYNAGKGNCVVIVAWNSHDIGGLTLLPSAIFGSRPDMDSAYLAKSFMIDQKVIAATQAIFK